MMGFAKGSTHPTRCIQTDRAIRRVPRVPGISVRRQSLERVPARYDNHPRVKVERPPFKCAAKDNSSVLRFQSEPRTCRRGMREQWANGYGGNWRPGGLLSHVWRPSGFQM